MKTRLIQLALFLWCTIPFDLVASYSAAYPIGEDFRSGTTISSAMAAKLIVSRSTFTPSSQPKPGQSIQLQMELTNVGNVTSSKVNGRFVVPVGVEAQGSASVSVPAIQAGGKQMLSFYFSYNRSFSGSSIAIVFETDSAPTLPAIKKTMFLSLNQTERSVGRNPENEIFWVTPDPDDHATGEKNVNKDKVDVKLITLGDGALAKKDFAIRINGRRAQGQKTDSRFVSPPRIVQGRNQQTFSAELKLKEGRNEVEIVYYEKDGKTIKNKSKTFVFNYLPPVKSSLYVLSVGVSSSEILGEKDARDFAKIFTSLPGAAGDDFEAVHIEERIGKNETARLSIAKAISQLQKAEIQPHDLVMVFLSMEAQWSEEDQYLLLPSDFDPDYASITALGFETDILQELGEVSGQKFLFLNTAPSKGPNVVSTGSVLQSVQYSQGIEIHAACNSLSIAQDYKQWGHSAFTKSILEAFRNDKVTLGAKSIQADGFLGASRKPMEADGAISVEEIGYFLKERMKYLKRNKEKVEYIHKPAYLIDREKIVFRPK